MNFKSRKVLVTGATGFVGSHLTEELVNLGAEVTATTHHPLLSNSYFKTQKLDQKCRVIKTDISDFSQTCRLFTNHSFSIIFHLAAQPLVDVAYDDPKTTLYTNILGTINVLECAKISRNTNGIVVASSDKAYGKKSSEFKDQRSKIIARGEELREAESSLDPDVMSGRIPRSSNQRTAGTLAFEDSLNRNPTSARKYLETDPLAGDHPYEVSKSATDLIAHSYFKTYGLPVVTTRFGNIYGEGDIHYSRLIPGIMKALVQKKIFEIRSNGEFVRDYLYVKDVVKGYLLLAQNMDKAKGEAFNFGSDDTYSVLQVIDLVNRILPVKLKYKILGISRNEIPYQSLDWTKIRKTLHWQPKYSISEVIQPIHKWYDKYCR